MKHNLENRNEKIKEYCQNLKSEVIAFKAKAIEHLEKECKQLMSEIDEYENQQIINEHEYEELNKMTNEIDDFNKRLEPYLNTRNNLKIKKEDFDDSFSKITEYKNNLDLINLKKITNLLFNNEYLKFKENESFFNATSNYLGNLELFDSIKEKSNCVYIF